MAVRSQCGVSIYRPIHAEMTPTLIDCTIILRCYLPQASGLKLHGDVPAKDGIQIPILTRENPSIRYTIAICHYIIVSTTTISCSCPTYGDLASLCLKMPRFPDMPMVFRIRWCSNRTRPNDSSQSYIGKRLFLMYRSKFQTFEFAFIVSVARRIVVEIPTSPCQYFWTP